MHYIHTRIAYTTPLDILPRQLALVSDLLAPLVKRKWDRDKSDTQERQRTTRPVDAQVLEHGTGEQRETGTECRPHQVVARQYTSD